jgi:capsular exopolysaccharide synthesis family protein
MSKFFDQTFKTRDVPVPVEEVKQPEVEAQPAAEEQVGVTTPPKVAPSETREVPLAKRRRLETPVAALLRVQFQGSDSLEQVQESYRALRTRLLRLRSTQGLRLILVTSAVPGEGKTLTSFNLALCCAQLNDMRVLLVDTDIRTHGLTRLLDSTASPGLSEVIAGTCKPEEAVLATDLPNLHVVTGGTPTLPPAELLANRKFQEFLGWATEKFKLILLDAPPILNFADVEIISAACDGVLMVVRAHKTRRDILQKSANQLDPKKLLGVVYNGAEGAHSHYTYAYQEPV